MDELYYMLLEDLITRNSQLILNDRFENLKQMSSCEGFVFKLKPEAEIEVEKTYEMPGLYVERRVRF